MNDLDEYDPMVVRMWRTCTWPLRIVAQAVATVLEFLVWLVFLAVTGMFALVERFEGVEGFFVWLVWLVTLPFRALYWGFGYLARQLLSDATYDKLLDSVVVFTALPWIILDVFRALYWGIGYLVRRLLPDAIYDKLVDAVVVFAALPWIILGGLGWLADVLFVNRIWPWIVWLSQPIWRPLYSLSCFSLLWLFTRDYRLIIWALPIALLLTPFPLVMLSVGGSGSDARIIERYRQGIAEALETGEYERSAVYERKLIQMGTDTSLSAYRTALALADEDQLEQAYQRMQQLAPLDETGYPRAHYWIARVLMSDELELPASEMQRLAGIHLAHLRSLGYDGPDVQWLRARWAVKEDRRAEAAELYGHFAEDVVVAAQERMRLLLTLGQDDQARDAARQVRKHMESRTPDSRPLTAQDFQLWATAEQLLENKEKQRTVLRRWHKFDPANSHASAALAGAARGELDELLRVPIPNHFQIAGRLHEIVELSDDPSQWLKQAREFYHLLVLAPARRDAMDELLHSPSSSSSVLHALSVVAVLQQNWNVANALLQRAVSLNPQNSVLWNNYAWLLMTHPDADLQKALDAANKALELSPQAGQCRETRGQIFVKLGRPQEAISDLTMALNTMPNYRPIHRSLAEAYEAIGDAEAAQAHRTLSQ